MAKKVPSRPKYPTPPGQTAPRAKEHPDAGHPGAVRGESPQQSVAAQQPLFPIVGVGASAGGLEAFMAFLKHLPDDSGMAFILIQHLAPKQHSQLTDLLSKATGMPLLEADADMLVEPNHVYVMAPGVCLSMSNRHIRVEERAGGRNLPIDHFLRSLAGDNTSKAIGIVLSGTASDGTLGLKAIKAEGGITFAQEPSSAKFDGMPRSAIAAGVVDFVLAPAEIAKRLIRLAKHPFVDVKIGEDIEMAKETESALNSALNGALPYRGPDNKIDGALLVMSDIDAIKNARDYAEAIVETVRQPLVVLTKDLRVNTANRAFFDTFHVSRAETEGRLIYDLGNGQWNIPKLREALESVLPEGGSFQDFQVSHTFDRIGRKTMLLSGRELKQLPLFGQEKILLAIDDITARREAEEARREDEERYRTLFNLGPVAVYSCDVSGVIRDFNPRAAELWGRSPKAGDTDERFCGSYKMLLPDGTFLPHAECPMAEVLSGKIPEARDMEVQIERPDGSRITVMVNIRVLKNERGEITGAINCFVDITAVKAIEDALRKSEEGLRRANDDLQHFAYAASHDLQEPLRMVTSYTQLLSKEYKGKLDKDANQFIAYAVEGAHRMDALLKGMRDYWQASEHEEEQRVDIDCNDVLEKALLNLQETVKSSGASVTHDSLPIVRAEEVRLVQLFQNLIGNAIKYRSKEPPRVHVSVERNGKKEWLFSVKDNGIGIDPRYAEKIFVIFSRLDGSKHPGSGMGLAICRKVVERLGGRIWVESKPGGGADFKFTIPAQE